MSLSSSRCIFKKCFKCVSTAELSAAKSTSLPYLSKDARSPPGTVIRHINYMSNSQQNKLAQHTTHNTQHTTHNTTLKYQLLFLWNTSRQTEDKYLYEIAKQVDTHLISSHTCTCIRVHSSSYEKCSDRIGCKCCQSINYYLIR
jgi:hypothetical protein